MDARGGIGKTSVLNRTLDYARLLDEDSFGIGVAFTGIAAQLLKGGRTFNSRFRFPLKPDNRSMCNISRQSGLAKLCQSMPEYTRVCQSMLESCQVLPKLCSSHPQVVPKLSPGSAQDVPKSSSVMPSRTHEASMKPAHRVQSLPEYARVCQSMPEYAGV